MCQKWICAVVNKSQVADRIGCWTNLGSINKPTDEINNEVERRDLQKSKSIVNIHQS